jgi:hypothetical protein
MVRTKKQIIDSLAIKNNKQEEDTRLLGILINTSTRLFF